MKNLKYILLLSLFALVSCKDADLSGDYDVAMVGENDYSNHDITLNIAMSDGENKISGKSACNSYFGSFEVVEGNQVKLSPMGMSKMMCPETIGIERDYHKHLRQVTQVNPTSDGLELLDENGSILITAIKK